jgi:hypothetical protein
LNAINRVVITGKLSNKVPVIARGNDVSVGMIRAVVSQVDERKKESSKGKHMNQFIITAIGPAAIALDKIETESFIRIKGSLQGRQSVGNVSSKNKIYQQIFCTDSDDVEEIPTAFPIINEAVFTGRIYSSGNITTQFITKVPGGDAEKNPDLVRFVIQSGSIKRQFDELKTSTAPLNLVFCVYKPKDPENFQKIAVRFGKTGIEVAATGALISVYHTIPGQKNPSYRLELIVREIQIFREPTKFFVGETRRNDFVDKGKRNWKNNGAKKIELKLSEDFVRKNPSNEGV